MTETELMELQMETLQTIKKIKQQRDFSNQPQRSSLNPPTSVSTVEQRVKWTSVSFAHLHHRLLSKFVPKLHLFVFVFPSKKAWATFGTTTASCCYSVGFAKLQHRLLPTFALQCLFSFVFERNDRATVRTRPISQTTTTSLSKDEQIPGPIWWTYWVTVTYIFLYFPITCCFQSEFCSTFYFIVLLTLRNIFLLYWKFTLLLLLAFLQVV